MAKIVNKLNLNKTPNLVENNSLIFAKNIRLLNDGTIGRDYGIRSVNIQLSELTDNVDAEIESLQVKREEYKQQVDYYKNLINNQEVKEDYEIFKDYFDELESKGNLVFNDVSIFESLYSVSGESYNKDNPGNIFNWEESWGEVDIILTPEELISYINKNQPTSITKLKLPIFPSYFYPFMVNNYSGNNSDVYKDIKGFNYARFLDVIDKFKTNYSNYSNYLTDVPDTRIEHNTDYGTDYYHQTYILTCYYGWFMDTIAPALMERLYSIEQQQSGVDINYKIQYYLDLISELDAQIKSLQNIQNTFDDFSNYKIVGTIPYDLGFYLCIVNKYTNLKSYIINYKEETGSVSICNVKWSWSGGKIIGNSFTNLRGQTILNIAEYKDDSTNIPFKSINLAIANYDLDESVYTQTPKIPFINFYFNSYYSRQIPNGVYQFFVRYKIVDDVYTNWFPATNVLFTGNESKVSTNVGRLKYVDTDVDSDKSFVFSIETLDADAVANYKEFQVGFILTYDAKTVAKAWKHFGFDTEFIYFDCDLEYLEDVDIEDFTSNTYGIFNVKNLTAFKNRLYISNYTETNFNPDFNELAAKVKVDINYQPRTNQSIDNTYTYVDTATGTKYTGAVTIIKSDITQNAYITNIDLPDLTNPEQIDSLAVSAITKMLLKGGTMRNIIPEIDSPSHTLHVLDIANCITYGIEIKAKVISEGTIDHSSVRNIYDVYNTNIQVDTVDAFINGLCSNWNEISCITGRFTHDEKEPYSNYVRYTYTPGYKNTNDNHTTYNSYTIELTIQAKVNNIFVEDSSKINVCSTLLPGQTYNFYIHYVKNTGEITNGYFINKVEVPFDANKYAIKQHSIIYPSFTNINVPSGYDYWFISIAHVNGFVSEVYNFGEKKYTLKGTNGGVINETLNLGHNMDLDTMNLNLIDDINCVFIDNDIVTESTSNEYHPSFDSSIGVLFGSSGVVKLNVPDGISNIYDVNNIFVTIPYSKQESDLTLTKCTPIISKSKTKYNNYKQCNLLGFICEITKGIKKTVAGADNLDFFDKYYVSGNTDIYDKTFVGDDIATAYPIPVIADDKSVINERLNGVTYTYEVYSNYNLNYLSLALTLTNHFRSYIIKSGNNEETKREFVCLPNSLEVSTIYELQSMYKEYVQKQYIQYTNTSINIFENTVRSSNLLQDEAMNFMYKFLATDYYNVPTDKGIIVNLVAAGNNILVHTRDSIYIFSGTNTLMSAGGEDINLAEQETPFDSGIQEIFGSEFGIYGLKNKEESIVLPIAYVWYDRDANKFYIYGSDNKIGNITDAIFKLVNRDVIKDITLAGDYTNDRFFINIVFKDNKRCILSYNFRINSFISLHDFTFDKAFYTKINCYFIKDDSVYIIDKNYVGYSDLTFEDTLYPSYSIKDNKSSIVDVIINENIETVKTLNSIDWIVNKVKSFGVSQITEDYKASITQGAKLSEDKDLFDRVASDYDFVYSGKNRAGVIQGVFDKGQYVEDKLNKGEFVVSKQSYSAEEISNINIIKILLAEEIQDNTYCGDKLRIYTDSCVSSLFDITKKSNDYSINSRDSYMYPRFNQGYWTFNYFRDIKNIKDIFNYIRKIETERTEAERTSDQNNIYKRQSDGYPQIPNPDTTINNDRRYSDNHSLIEGRYFVVRFVFDIINDFKLENISLNYNNKI